MKKFLFIGYKNCSTSNKAQQWLDDNNVSYEFRDIKTENPKFEELKKWHEISSRDIRKMFNTSGLMYKDLALKEKLPNMSEKEQLELLATNGMLVKRPVLVSDTFVLFGFKEEEWKNSLLKK